MNVTHFMQRSFQYTVHHNELILIRYFHETDMIFVNKYAHHDHASIMANNFDRGHFTLVFIMFNQLRGETNNRRSVLVLTQTATRRFAQGIRPKKNHYWKFALATLTMACLLHTEFRQSEKSHWFRQYEKATYCNKLWITDETLPWVRVRCTFVL